MDNRLLFISGLVGLALLAGLWWRARTGRAKLVRSGELVDLGKLKPTKNGKPITSFGKKATLLQFSTEVCSACRQTARLYQDLEKQTPGLSHMEVDITDRMELAAHFGILQTPTTLILDKTGRVKSRIGGAPRPNVILEELEKLENK